MNCLPKGRIYGTGGNSSKGAGTGALNLSIDLPAKTIRKAACDAGFQSALEGNYPEALDRVKRLANGIDAAPTLSVAEKPHDLKVIGLQLTSDSALP